MEPITASTPASATSAHRAAHAPYKFTGEGVDGYENLLSSQAFWPKHGGHPLPHHILESPGALALDLGSLFDPAPPGGDVLQSSHLRQRFQRGV